MQEEENQLPIGNASSTVEQRNGDVGMHIGLGLPKGLTTACREAKEPSYWIWRRFPQHYRCALCKGRCWMHLSRRSAMRFARSE